MKLEGSAYWLLFAASFLAVAVWESYRQRRPLTWPAQTRWARHGIVTAITFFLQILFLRVSPIAFAATISNSPYGILNRSWPPFLVRCVAAVLLIDLAHYAIHRLFHSFGFLWRVHEVHHSDPDYDVSTGARFHPLETLLTVAAMLLWIAILAPPPVAVFAAQLISVVVNFYEHANANLPPRIERVARYLMITPGLHRIHHSLEIAEQSRNYGQTFSWWDRIFGTYLPVPAAGEERLATGVEGLQNEGSLTLAFLLTRPFQRRRLLAAAAAQDQNSAAK